MLTYLINQLAIFNLAALILCILSIIAATLLSCEPSTRHEEKLIDKYSKYIPHLWYTVLFAFLFMVLSPSGETLKKLTGVE